LNDLLAAKGLAEGSTRESLVKLADAVGKMIASGAPPSADYIESLLLDGGFFYEAKLRRASENPRHMRAISEYDLKGLLLGALADLPWEHSTFGLKDALTAFLANIELQQVENLLAQLDGTALQLQIPLASGAVFTTVALAVAADGGKQQGRSGAEKRNYSLLFVLQLEGLGAVRIDARLGEEKLSAVFFLEKESSLELVRQELTEFRERLVSLGYENPQLEAKLARDIPPEKQQSFAALAAGAPASVQLLDLRA
jgi:hypothetical protein